MNTSLCASLMKYVCKKGNVSTIYISLLNNKHNTLNKQNTLSNKKVSFILSTNHTRSLSFVARKDLSPNVKSEDVDMDQKINDELREKYGYLYFTDVEQQDVKDNDVMENEVPTSLNNNLLNNDIPSPHAPSSDIFTPPTV
jgi:hypothetical protein